LNGFFNPRISAIFGATWILGRFLYARNYEKRGFGFRIAGLSMVAVTLMTLYRGVVLVHGW